MVFLIPLILRREGSMHLDLVLALDKPNRLDSPPMILAIGRHLEHASSLSLDFERRIKISSPIFLLCDSMGRCASKELVAKVQQWPFLEQYTSPSSFRRLLYRQTDDGPTHAIVRSTHP